MSESLLNKHLKHKYSKAVVSFGKPFHCNSGLPFYAKNGKSDAFISKKVVPGQFKIIGLFQCY